MCVTKAQFWSVHLFRITFTKTSFFQASSEDLRNHGVAEKLMQKLEMRPAELERCESDYNIALFPYYICAGGDKGELHAL